MGESKTHNELVLTLIDWTRRNFINGHVIMFEDSPEAQKKPPKIGGHIPDLYAKDLNNGAILIGEAKRISDLNQPRTISQLTDFIKYLALQPKGILLVAAPLFVANGFHNLVDTIAQSQNLNSLEKIIISPEINGQYYND